MSDAAATVRPGDELDWQSLEAHLRTVLDLPDEPMTVHQFAGGRANLTYLVTFGGVRLVVRRPPRGALAPGAHDMGREHRVLSSLSAAYPRAPRSLHFCDDESVVGAPFVVVEHREGVVIRDVVPDAMTHHPHVERRVDLALIDAAADLHGVDPTTAGLGDVGRPDGFGERQVRGWLDRWGRAAPDDAPRVMHEVADRLATSLPSAPRSAIVHLDLKLDNCQFQPGDPDVVTSVFDWEMATLGDPLFDLGLLLVSMESLAVWVLSTDEAVARYAERSGIDVTDVDWYIAFATWRMAVVLQQLYNRYRNGDTADERFASYGTHIAACAEQAWGLIA